MYLKHKILLFLTVMFLPLFGQDIPEPMSPPRLVNDFAKIFTAEQNESLERALLAYNDSTSTQIYVVTVTDLKGYAASDFATTLGQEWGIGQKGKDNGLVILIKPRIGNSRGDVFIATGYGVEHVLNDARVGRIIDNYMIPYFAQGDYYSGTRNAIVAIMKSLSGEFDADSAEGVPAGAIVALLVVIALLFIAYTRGPKDNNHRGGNSSRGGGMFFPPFGGGRSSGGWGGGGFGGGGFGGGGGGGFGGGGAGRGF